MGPEYRDTLNIGRYWVQVLGGGKLSAQYEPKLFNVRGVLLWEQWPWEIVGILSLGKPKKILWWGAGSNMEWVATLESL